MTFPNGPLLNQWVAGPPYEEINSVKMFQRVDTNFNTLLNYVNAQVRFFGSIVATAGSISANTNVSFTGHIVEDTANAWNSTNNNWVCPQSSIYLMIAGMKCNSTPAQPIPRIVAGGAGYSLAPTMTSLAFSGQVFTLYSGINVGTTIALQSINAYATQNDGVVNNFFQILQIGANNA